MSTNATFRASLTLDAPLERLWPLISDTDRVNRLIGLPPFERAAPEPDLTQQIKSHYFGMPVSWREFPFEWTFEQWFRVERVFDAPFPVERLITGTSCTVLPGDRTRVDVLIESRSRNILGQLATHVLIGQKMLRDLLQIYQSFGQLAAAAGRVILPPPAPPIIKQEQLQVGIRQLKSYGVAPALI